MTSATHDTERSTAPPPGAEPASQRSIPTVVALVALAALTIVLGPTLWPSGSGGDAVRQAGGLGVDPAEASDAEQLLVHVRTPSRLVVDHVAPLAVSVAPAGGGELPESRRLAVRIDLDLEEEARGWVVVAPTRWTTTGGALAGERIEMLGFGELPCADQVGTMRVVVRELVEDGRSGSATAVVPGAACDEHPDAPEGLHHDRPVRLEDWQRRGEDALRAPPPPAPRTWSGPSGGSTPAPPAEEEPEPAEEEPEEPAEEEPEEPAEEAPEPDGGEPSEPEPPEEPEVPREHTPEDDGDGGEATSGSGGSDDRANGSGSGSGDDDGSDGD